MEGIVADTLSSIIDSENEGNSLLGRGDRGSGGSDKVNNGEVSFQLDNLLVKAIKIKRNIHNHDIIRQIGDKTYMMKRTYETARAILSILTEGEGSNVNVKLGESANCIEGKEQVSPASREERVPL